MARKGRRVVSKSGGHFDIGMSECRSMYENNGAKGFRNYMKRVLTRQERRDGKREIFLADVAPTYNSLSGTHVCRRRATY